MAFTFNLTAGIVIDNEGHVLTRLVNVNPNNPSPDIKVKTSDGRSLKAEVLLGAYAQEPVSTNASDSGGAIFAAGVAGNLIVPKGSGFAYTAPHGTTGITNVKVKEKRNSGGSHSRSPRAAVDTALPSAAGVT